MSQQYLKPGIAAIALAILFPIYWIYVLTTGGDDYAAAYQNDLLTLSWLDALFLLIGALEVYIYLSLRNTFNNLIKTKAARAALAIMASMVVVFHAPLILDLIFFISNANAQSTTVIQWIEISFVSSIVALTIFSLTGLIFGVMLLVKKQYSGGLIKAFAVILLLMCAFQLTFVFSFLSIILFPLALTTLAIYFLKEPETVEVV